MTPHDTAEGAAPGRRVILDGIQLDPWDLPAVMAELEEACAKRLPLQIMTVNVNYLTLARKKPFFRQVLQSAGLAVVDGRLLLWILRLAGEGAPRQVTGHDLVHASIPLAAARGWRIYLLGGAPGVAEGLAARLASENPGLAVKGSDGGRFTETGGNDGNAELVAQVAAFRPHLLFVALGNPKQDCWIHDNITAVGGPVAIGVGGVFDTLTGSLPRAPRWMQVAGLESLFQLCIEPGRYARRYLIEDPPTLLRLAWLAIRQRRAGPTL